MSVSASVPVKNMTSQVSPGARPRSLARALSSSDSGAAALARLTLAAVMFPHGAQKLLGWFGGYGFAGTYGFLTQQTGLPALVAVLVIAIEFFAPLLLLLGLATRAAALGIGAVMVGAIATVHASQGFFMNWSGSQGGEGFEYHLLALGLVAVLLLQGGGRWSLDRRLSRS